MADPPVHSVARANERGGSTRRAPAQAGLAIGSSWYFGCAAGRLRSVGWRGEALGHGWRAGSEEEIGRERSVDRRRAGLMQQRLLGRVCREKIDRNGAVMAEREANLAIMVVASRQDREHRGGHAGGSRTGISIEGRRVVMPRKQHGVQQDRKNADLRGSPALPTDPNLRGEAHPHLDPVCEPGDKNGCHGGYIITLGGACEPLSRLRCLVLS